METSPPVSITPRFAFGIKGDLRNSLYFLDDQRVVYPCGHNVVILSIGDDKTQEYIPCTEGSEGITAMALSHSKTHLAVCERSERAICTIHNISSAKRKK